ncbi:MAG: hypothetical protein VCF24_26050 [Candidatus Latescibacterota bacterium]
MREPFGAHEEDLQPRRFGGVEVGVRRLGCQEFLVASHHLPDTRLFDGGTGERGVAGVGQSLFQVREPVSFEPHESVLQTRAPHDQQQQVAAATFRRTGDGANHVP